MTRSIAMTALLSAASQAVLSYASGEVYNPVELKGYGTFSGTTINETYGGDELPQAVDAWLGMDYAVQPVGDRRFKPTVWAEPFDGVKAADEYGKACVQEISDTITEDMQDEACLNFNVYRTQTSLDKKLPVLVWIHGGYFMSGSYTSFDGASFAASSKEPIVVVSFHYRVNSLGSLPSELFLDEGLANINIRDQRLFLEFIHKHVESFGGDPDAITIGGRSAGAHSSGIHHAHQYGDDKGAEPLFAGVILQSGSVTSRNFPNASYPLYKEQYDEYMSYIGCDDLDDNEETLECLRSADIDEIRDISTKIFKDNEVATTWPFQPVHGGPLFEKSGAQSGVDGTFYHVPILASTVTDEAKLYLPGDLETNEEFMDFMYNISPQLNETDLELLEELYSDPATDPDSPFANSPNSTQYDRLSAAWSDYGYICPGQESAYRSAAAGVPTWKVRFNTNQSYPEWKGIPHGADAKYTWDEPAVQYPEISHIYHAYLASFVTTGNPNTHRYPGSPKWPMYEPEGNELGDDPGKQLVVQPKEEGGTQAEDDDIRREACLYWRDIERAPRLNK